MNIYTDKLVIVAPGGDAFMGDVKKTNTTFGNVDNSAVIIDSDNASAEVHVDQSSVTQPVDAAASDLLAYVHQLPAETAAMVEQLIKQATDEVKKKAKDHSKIAGLLGVIEPVIQTIPAALDAFSKWASFLH